MGSEMCIRDRLKALSNNSKDSVFNVAITNALDAQKNSQADFITCLLYTSDAADEEDSVDLGVRRIIKKKNLQR